MFTPDSKPVILKSYGDNDTADNVDFSFARIRKDWIVTSDDLQSKNVFINGKMASFPHKGIPSSLDYAVTSDPTEELKIPGHSYAFFQYCYE